MAVIALFAGGTALRLIYLTNPPLDIHGWRQLRGACIARGMYYSMLPDVDSELRDQARYLGGTFQHQEPNYFEMLTAKTYLLAGGEYLWIARLYAIFFWLVGGAALFALAWRMSAAGGALAALAYYLFLPYAVSHSRMFIPDVMMVPLILLGLLAAYRWSESGSWKWSLLAGLFCGTAMLVKVFAVFFLLLPVGLMLLAKPGLLKSLRSVQVWAMFIIMALIPALHYLSLPQGQGAAYYLETWSEPFRLLLFDINFYIGWFHKLGQFDLTLVVVALISLVFLPPPGRALVSGLWLGYAAFGMVLPAPIRSHSYYSLPVVFIVALSLAGAGQLLFERAAKQPVFWRLVFTAACLLGLADAALMGRKEVRQTDYSQEPAFWQALGKQLPTDGTYIGLSEDYNSRIQYYGWRFVQSYTFAADYDMGRLSGHEFNNEEASLENWKYFLDRTHPYRYFLVTSLDEFEKQPYLKHILYDYYPAVMQGERYVLFDLWHPTQALPEVD